jgi:hypothetical protein
MAGAVLKDPPKRKKKKDWDDILQEFRMDTKYKWRPQESFMTSFFKWLKLEYHSPKKKKK